MSLVTGQSGSIPGATWELNNEAADYLLGRVRGLVFQACFSESLCLLDFLSYIPQTHPFPSFQFQWTITLFLELGSLRGLK